MKDVYSKLLFGFSFILLISCKSEEEPGLRIEISDKFILTENDIEFYDSSTCMLFLIEEISLPIRNDKNSNSDFSIYVDGELIFDGVFFPSMSSALPPSPIYVACYAPDTFSSYVLHFKYNGFNTNAIDDRNNSRLVSFYKERSLLRNGIICKIDSLGISPSNKSVLNIDLRIQNSDLHPYLIPDLSKISSDQFVMLTSGCILRDLDTGNGYGQELDNYMFDKSIMSLENLSVINAQEEKTFSIIARFIYEIGQGNYKCELNFGNIGYLIWIDLELNQSNGRVWIGENYSEISFIIDD